MKKRKNKNAWYWMFLAVCLVSLVIVVFIPLAIGIWYSFTDWTGINNPTFIGMKNYARLKDDKLFWHSLLFSAKFSAVSVIAVNTVGLALAMLVTRNIKGKNALRTIFFMPNLIGGLILGFIWQFIFVDIFDSISRFTGIKAFSGWLADPNTGFWGMVILAVWQMGAYVMVIYIAFIESIPEELLEAAEIDGVTPFQRFRHIIFPLIAPAFTINLFITLSNGFKLFDQNLALTNGGPGNMTQMVALNIYQTAFGESMMAYAQIKAVIFLVIVATFSLTQVYINKKREVEL
ncbi:MAG: maltose transport system permease protein [Thermoanaerobacteraceae bacterium]|jgi:raffinose/stachyose/melibiose transport system permease protein|nr:maltose transport system permease protein [Thermoanaerobacteraceae bacterium]MDN5311873.1 maltose transport system permease protein [Thermoanaerobacteraceae bacterium]